MEALLWLPVLVGLVGLGASLILFTIETARQPLDRSDRSAAHAKTAVTMGRGDSASDRKPRRLDRLVSRGLRPLTYGEIEGGHLVGPDVEAIAGYITGSRVLVTGAGGVIGAEMCRQIYRYAPSELILLDRDESALDAVQLSIEGRALRDSSNLIVADVRDIDRIWGILAERRPEIVFHAAGLKHLPLLEMHPAEAVKTNVWGTLNLLDAAAQFGVTRFINLSTDKAADPSSVLGYTKRLAERLTAATAASATGTYLSVRFGNMLDSRASVLTAFTSQIEHGGPVTVTHPDATRHFMTVEHAAELILQAGAVGRDGEVLAVHVGEPVNLDEIARRLIDQAEQRVEIVYTGLRPGEKLHEVLLGVDEHPSEHSGLHIAHVPVPPTDPAEVRSLRLDEPNEVLIGELRRLCDDRWDREFSGGSRV